MSVLCACGCGYEIPEEALIPDEWEISPRERRGGRRAVAREAILAALSDGKPLYKTAPLLRQLGVTRGAFNHAIIALCADGLVRKNRFGGYELVRDEVAS